MVKTTAPPSPSRRTVDVRDWVGGVRLSAFSGIMLGLVVLAAFALVPTIGTYLDQRQQIAALQESVRLSEEQVVALEAERDRWADPAYITSQARERLYYVKPGEVVYLVDDDLPQGTIPPEQAPVSEDVEETTTDWMTQFVRSVANAGLARSVAVED
ncbi:septum formation initiator family protein [uncultured Microbacterium sp.]|uniref:Septum formation initiator n=1 Tax=uncultured Microbacterium sp. TaxID=191216 RepID=A0A1Y5NXU7_9MICO|nr:septum formation initiator family protein [uncultured Microbacterium sp.]SBS70120.1 Septum formation initiator [uncultured Microbacterium sp.]